MIVGWDYDLYWGQGVMGLLDFWKGLGLKLEKKFIVLCSCFVPVERVIRSVLWYSIPLAVLIRCLIITPRTFPLLFWHNSLKKFRGFLENLEANYLLVGFLLCYKSVLVNCPTTCRQIKLI